MIYDVIVAGAGPVGLFLACELRLAKLSVLVLEALADPYSPMKKLPFGMRGLWGPSIETFYRRGLLDRVVAPRGPTGAPGKAGQPGPPVPASTASAAPARGPAVGYPTRNRDGAPRSRARRSRALPRRRNPARPWGLELRIFERRGVATAAAAPRGSRADSSSKGRIPTSRDIRCKSQSPSRTSSCRVVITPRPGRARWFATR